MYNSSIYPIKINKYQPQQNKPVQNNEEQGQSGASTKQEQKEKSYNTIYKPTPGYYGNAAFNKFTIQNNAQHQINKPQQNIPQNNLQQPSITQNSTGMVRQSFPNGEKTAIDYTQSKINISQVIKDFKNTTEAIGSPDDIKDTVYTYISLVQKEAEKDNPNKKIIQSNLKNASQVLDEYITDTLKKPSKVVEGWIDSLFLQNVDYKYDASIINPDYQVKLPDKNQTEQSEPLDNNSQSQQQINETLVQKTVDNTTKNPFFASLITAKKEKNPAEALNMYSEIIQKAVEENDSKAQSIAYFESGKLYDSFNSFGRAVENYTSAIKISDDDGLKAQAYMKIAQIHHDSADLQEAEYNYFSSIGYFGQTENLKAQAVLLSQTGKLASEGFDKQNAQDYFYVASALADELNDKNLTGKISQKAGESFAYMNEPRKALGYYKDSAASFNSTQNNLELANDYRSAAKLMLELGNPAKARTLLNKAFRAGLMADDKELVQKIQAEIEVIA